MKKLFFGSIVTLFGAGKFPYGPGTFGSIVSFLIFIILFKIFSFSQIHFFILIILSLFLALYCVKEYEKITKTHDDKSIVIDEFLGVFITCSFMLFVTQNIWVLLGGMIIFRVFDIWKPGVIGKIDRETPGAAGVIFDDILAGILSGFLSICILLLIGFVWK